MVLPFKAYKGATIPNQTDATEPYFVVPATYENRGRSFEFSLSCFTFASGSTYYSKRESSSSSGSVLSNGAYAGIVIGAVVLVVGLVFLAYVIIKERKGEPLFMPLKNVDEDNIFEI